VQTRGEATSHPPVTSATTPNASPTHYIYHANVSPFRHLYYDAERVTHPPSLTRRRTRHPCTNLYHAAEAYTTTLNASPAPHLYHDAERVTRSPSSPQCNCHHPRHGRGRI
jgi:hypothetical protein